MMQMAVPWFLVNLLLLIGIGFIRQPNPLDLIVPGLLIVGNGMVVLAAAVLTSDNSVSALIGLATTLLPFALTAGGIALLLVVLMFGNPKRGARS